MCLVGGWAEVATVSSSSRSCTRIVTYLILLCRILAGILENDLGPSRMLWHELRNVVGFAMDDDPAVFVVVMFCDLCAGKTHGCFLGLALTGELNEEGTER